MSYTSRIVRLSLVVLSCTGWLALNAASASAETRHHITIGFGYSKLVSDDVKDPATGADFSDAANGVLAYRYSLNPGIDLTLDSRGTASTQSVQGVNLWLLNSFFGPGVRWNPAIGGGRLYVQGSFFFSNEEVELEQGGTTISSSESGTGFGVFGGVDIPLSSLLSMPLEVNYIYSKPADDVSGVGITIGLAFNWGQMQ